MYYNLVFLIGVKVAVLAPEGVLVLTPFSSGEAGRLVSLYLLFGSLERAELALVRQQVLGVAVQLADQLRGTGQLLLQPLCFFLVP